MKILIASLITLALSTTAARAQDIQASLADLPNPGFSAFLDEMGKNYPSGSFSFKKYPFPRSISNAINNQASFHMPLLENPLVPEELLPFNYSTEAFADVSFVIYSHKSKSITREQLDNLTYTVDEALLDKPFIPQAKRSELNQLAGDHSSWLALSNQFETILGEEEWSKISLKVGAALFPFKIETERNHTAFFDFPTVGGTDLAAALKKVNVNRIDAFILAQEDCDSIVRELRLSNISRSFFQTFKAKFVIGRHAGAEQTDQIISEIINRMKAAGTFDELSSGIHGPYIEWQPHESL